MIQTFVPPYVLKHLEEHGTPQEKEVAKETLRLTTHLEGMRAAVKDHPPVFNQTGETRFTFNTNHSTQLPGMLARRESQPPVADSSINNAYDSLGFTFDFYTKAFGRNSIDNRGMALLGSVHYYQNFNNAFWNGRQMVFGDGDGVIFTGFTNALDVIGHELSHGVTQYISGLNYYGQSGALNEHFSDVMGIMVKQMHLNQTVTQADWILGEGILGPTIKGKGLRSMAAPGTAYNDPRLGKDPQPAHMKDYVQTTQDNGGVHVNDGIPNHAFYKIAMALGGHAWEKAGQIWYKTNQSVRPNCDFQTWANTTYHIALQYNAQPAVKDGWAAVGIIVQ